MGSNNQVSNEINSFKLIEKEILNPSDFINIKGKTYINKSGYRKIALALNISIEIIKENRIEKDSLFIYDFTVRATNSAGRYIESSASCSSNEREFNNINHDVRSTAQTRATNRAISDLIGIYEIHSYVSNTKIEPITNKQRILLVKLVESKYSDESTRNTLYKKIELLNKEEANKKIKQLIEEGVEIPK